MTCYVLREQLIDKLDLNAFEYPAPDLLLQVVLIWAVCGHYSTTAAKPPDRQGQQLEHLGGNGHRPGVCFLLS